MPPIDDARAPLDELVTGERDIVKRLMAELFPRFHEEEARIAALMTAGEREAVTAGLRRIVRDLPDTQDQHREKIVG